MFNESDLVAIAKRENNKKRNYLVVNPLQGKHVPVSPTRAFQLFDQLADKVRQSYDLDEDVLFVGFAETATAIGARLALNLGGAYIQTTREQIEGVNYLYFSEEHSHATEQKLVKEDIDLAGKRVKRIIFVEDEVTTGNTILGIINILDKQYKDCFKYAVASILNGMNQECLGKYKERGIDLIYVLKTCHENYSEQAEKYKSMGQYFESDLQDVSVQEIRPKGYMNTRRMVDSKAYADACNTLWQVLKTKLNISSGTHILVMGTEEFMYPALFVGEKLEEEGCKVKSHSTTRSPIAVYSDKGYPLSERYELKSLYDDERRTFVYNLDSYDQVIIITDAKGENKVGENSLLNAIKKKNDNILLVRWC